ncbi:MAG: hypothetical protein ACYTET_03515 [Planctomycetota bacterium]
MGTFGDYSTARAINDLGQVVGYSAYAELDLDDLEGRHHYAYLWENGTMIELESLLPENSGWEGLVGAYGINNNGQIVGTGIIDGENHAFLLTPTLVPETTTLLLFGLGGLVLRKRPQ